jgi:hypothetical protein
MTTDQIKSLQNRVGTAPDGFWGPISTAACQRHLRSLMPTISPWPASDEASLRSFYGTPGESHLVNLNVEGLGVEYIGSPVKTIRCHTKVAESLHRVLSAIANSECKWILRKYAGCFNHRPMRGGTRLSTHSWGVAIDLWPARNGNTVHWPTRAEMPIEVMEAFAREGWLSAGAFWSRDAMHAQATK